MNKSKEIPGKSQCPCESKKIYSNCCKKKFKFVLHNNTLKKVIPIHKDLFQILKDIEARFIEFYGRKLTKSDHVFAFAPIYNDESLLEGIKLFRELGFPENKIYAYYKSDGLFPCDLNIDLLSEVEIEEYLSLSNKYDKLVRSKGKKLIS